MKNDSINNEPKIFNTTKTYTNNNTYILRLSLDSASEIKLRTYIKTMVKIYNRVLSIQMDWFDQGSIKIFPKDEIRNNFLPKWKKEFGGGVIVNTPNSIIEYAIVSACNESKEAFKGRLKFKFPSLVKGNYRHIRFKKLFSLEEQYQRIQFPQFKTPYRYSVLSRQGYINQPGIVGSIKAVWLIYHENCWKVVIWTQFIGSAGIRVIKQLSVTSKQRVLALAPYVYHDNHWMVSALEEISEQRLIDSYGPVIIDQVNEDEKEIVDANGE